MVECSALWILSADHPKKVLISQLSCCQHSHRHNQQLFIQRTNHQEQGSYTRLYCEACFNIITSSRLLVVVLPLVLLVKTTFFVDHHVDFEVPLISRLFSGRQNSLSPIMPSTTSTLPLPPNPFLTTEFKDFATRVIEEYASDFSKRLALQSDGPDGEPISTTDGFSERKKFREEVLAKMLRDWDSARRCATISAVGGGDSTTGGGGGVALSIEQEGALTCSPALDADVAGVVADFAIGKVCEMESPRARVSSSMKQLLPASVMAMILRKGEELGMEQAERMAVKWLQEAQEIFAQEIASVVADGQNLFYLEDIARPPRLPSARGWFGPRARTLLEMRNLYNQLRGLLVQAGYRIHEDPLFHEHLGMISWGGEA